MPDGLQVYIGDIITSLSDAGEVDALSSVLRRAYGYLAGDHVRDKDAVSTSLLDLPDGAITSSGARTCRCDAQLYEKYGQYYHNKTISLSYPGAECTQRWPASWLVCARTRPRSSPVPRLRLSWITTPA